MRVGGGRWRGEKEGGGSEGLKERKRHTHRHRDRKIDKERLIESDRNGDR